MAVMGRPKKDVSEENMRRFQKELELAGEDSNSLLVDKKGRSRACLLCRRRKQKCDHKQPSCTTCLKANVKCIQPAKYGAGDYSSDVSSPSSLPSSSVLRVKRNKSNSKAGASTSSGSPMPGATLLGQEAAPMTSKAINTAPTTENAENGLAKHTQYVSFLENKIKLLESFVQPQIPLNQQYPIQFQPQGNPSLQASASIPNSTAGELRLPTPAANTQNNLTFFVNKSSFQKDYVPALASDSLDSIDFSKCIFAKYNLKEFLDYDPVFEFDEITSRSFLDMFFNRLQFKYPLLDEQEIYVFHEDYIRNSIRSYSDCGFHFACGRMWLVFSISACLCMTTGKYRGLPSVRYFSTAIRHITRCGQNLNYVQQIELLTLLVLYILRTDRDSSVLYDIIKDVMYIIKDKLAANQWNPNDPFAHKRLRLFWCVYLLERMICVAVGRSFTIKESEINLPLFNENSFNTRPMPVSSASQNQTRGVHFINQSLKLRRIESQFVEKLNILPQRQNRKELLREQLPLVKKFFHDLEVWRSSCSSDNVKNFENETLKLYYYRSVRLLIQPYLEFLAPEDRLFKECQAAAGQICQLYKIFHQKTLTGHSTPAVHTVFVAGVTLIYCMWLARNNDDKRRRKLGDASKHTRPLISASLFSTMDDLRACSVCLYVMTERSKFARIFRDTFDQLMSATVGNLIERCGPDSSELIFLSQSKVNGGTNAFSNEILPNNTGMPPAVDRIFGSRQAEEHVGFVEISQVDPEEQKELKKKQGDLEKTSVPKSLSHLLIKVENPHENDRGKLSSCWPHASAAQSEAKQIDSLVEQDETNNQYIVKKPTTSEESDWRLFQQQALLQQHSARQNLQACLSSLKYTQKQGDSLAFDNFKSSIRPADRSSNMTKTFIEDHVNNNDLQPNLNSGLKGNEIAYNQGNVNEIGNCEQSSVQALTPMVSSQNGSQENSPDSLLNGGILFNNGTHNMINNISTWTKDSVANFLSDEVPFHDMFCGKQDGTSINQQQQQSSIQPQPQLPHTQQLYASNLSVSSIADNRIHNTYEPHSFPETPGNSEPHDKIFEEVNMGGDLKGTHEQRKAQIQLPSTTSKEDKFWTVNDDYGFLA